MSNSRSTRVKLVIEIDIACGPWGDDATLAQVLKQSMDEARAAGHRAAEVLQTNRFPTAQFVDIVGPSLLVPLETTKSKHVQVIG